MIISNRANRRFLCFAARVGALGSALVLVVTALSWFLPAGAATNAGNATVADPNTGQPMASGDTNTGWTLKLPQDAACTGDSPNAGYRVQSFMVPSSVDPGTLTYDANGPTPQSSTGANFREPLFDTTSNPYVNAQTAAATTPGGPGPIINIPTFNFAVYTANSVAIPPGTYNIGIACTLGPPSATQLDKYWTAQMTIATSGSGVTWTAAAPTGTTTTTPTGSTTTTTPTGSTTTTLPTDSTTTTTSSGSTTTTAANVLGSSGGSGTPSGSTAAGGSDPSSASPSGSSSGAPLAATGWGVVWVVVWAGVLIAFGRIAYLLGRPLVVSRVKEDR